MAVGRTNSPPDHQVYRLCIEDFGGKAWRKIITWFRLKFCIFRIMYPNSETHQYHHPSFGGEEVEFTLYPKHEISDSNPGRGQPGVRSWHCYVCVPR